MSQKKDDYMRGYKDGFKDGLSSPVRAPAQEQSAGKPHEIASLLLSGSTLKPCTKHPDRYCNCEGFVPACWDGQGTIAVQGTVAKDTANTGTAIPSPTASPIPR
ncbi:hypothetical protein [Mesorhizobium sp. M1A.F.Ca.IN.020.04.1.1]|uniref:hypothetical protein n=1 Tax=Mesorhizobium sp. M1A.F.Ca.IN.020.04.1.1 TaxID=2496761 RepID=UPI000FCA38F5|nr:hypothetical protein [Mesorhizobium sp. M1A.F.Ca.IN.020.04.1.1]RUW04022.1 hypothetical protein EOA49_00390 [Mesorhizobium sp. M1A.F.Ca.IN.020.04.1.1]RUW04085.1 hypothetical protein EOA49_00725 [Mesorhizobium sp. M1A.F.Ca.IN.020.04.1.1]